MFVRIHAQGVTIVLTNLRVICVVPFGPNQPLVTEVRSAIEVDRRNDLHICYKHMTPMSVPHVERA